MMSRCHNRLFFPSGKNSHIKNTRYCTTKKKQITLFIDINVHKKYYVWILKMYLSKQQMTQTMKIIFCRPQLRNGLKLSWRIFLSKEKVLFSFLNFSFRSANQGCVTRALFRSSLQLTNWAATRQQIAFILRLTFRWTEIPT